MKNKKVYYIRWMDHWAASGWNEAANFRKKDKGYPCESVGFLLHEDDKSIRLALSFSDQNDSCADVITILKSDVVKKKKLATINGEFKDKGD